MLLIGQSETMLSFRESCPCQSKKHRSILYENMKQGKTILYNETVFLCCGYIFDRQKVGKNNNREKTKQKPAALCGPICGILHIKKMQSSLMD